MSEVNLRIGTVNYTGWKTASISRSIESLCGSFSLELIDGFTPELWPITPNVEADIDIDNTPVMRGLIDRISPSIKQDSRGLSVSGRDTTADLVDCSAMNEPGTWRNNTVTVTTLARALCAPFDVRVIAERQTAEKFTHTIQAGESPFESLARANEFEGALFLTDERGRLLITSPGQGEPATDKLVTGENIIEASAAIDYSDRFSDYTVKGQAREIGDGWNSNTVSVKASSSDPIIASKRFRPKLIVAEKTVNTADAQNRADLEATVRAAKSSQVTVTVAGWAQRSGRLWPLNGLVSVNIPELQLTDRKMLITSVNYSKSIGEGSRTIIELRREDAYKALVKKQVRTGTANGYGW